LQQQKLALYNLSWVWHGYLNALIINMHNAPLINNSYLNFAHLLYLEL
jgi:hypothetical protein